MARSESTVRVGISPKKAFQMWSDIMHLSDFLPCVTDARPQGDGTFNVELMVGEREENTRIAFTVIDKPRRLVWRSSGGARWNGELIFRPTVEGTEIRYIVDYESSARRFNPTERSSVVPTWNVGADLLSFKNYAEKVQVEDRQAEAVGA